MEFESPQLLPADDVISTYAVEAEGGRVGTLQDIIVEDETWAIPYLLSGDGGEISRSLVATDYVQTIDLGTKTIYVSLARDAITGGLVLSSAEPAITAEFEQSLREYYDRYAR